MYLSQRTEQEKIDDEREEREEARFTAFIDAIKARARAYHEYTKVHGRNIAKPFASWRKEIWNPMSDAERKEAAAACWEYRAYKKVQGRSMAKPFTSWKTDIWDLMPAAARADAGARHVAVAEKEEEKQAAKEAAKQAAKKAVQTAADQRVLDKWRRDQGEEGALLRGGLTLSSDG